MGLAAKPDVAAFQAVLNDIGADASECAMFEDSLKNLATVRSQMMYRMRHYMTIHVVGFYADLGDAWFIP